MEREPTIAYLEACLPETFDLLGQRLHPFCLGHYKILLRIGNWYTQPSDKRKGTVPHLGDLLLGVWVCCQTYEEALAGLADPKTAKKVAKWGRRIAQADLTGPMVSFGQYISEAMQWPETYEAEHVSRIPGAPFVQRVQLVLQGRLGHTPSQALNKPWCEAVWDYLAFWEMEGAIKLIGEGEDAQVLLAEEMRLACERLLDRGAELTPEAIDAEILAARKQRQEGDHAL